MEFPQVKIREKLNELVNLRLNKGVSPVELSSNIYNEEYTEIRLKRNFDFIMCDVYFYDEDLFEEKRIKYEYRYVYNKNFYLQKILQIKKKKETIVWDRKSEEYAILLELIDLIEEHKNQLDINFFDTFPNDLKELIMGYINRKNDMSEIL
ncbi:hypothetical protein CON70_05460 [Bacillus pseudomycoides]|uniref:hypothetical protein n=1 Tax=Bacillus pseudomycoides TaxID=64104 RepID=UPI000BEB6939|nr:hypothetical protein [Bacillus pseudomycoides]PDZ12573.1 hypothetical protein CON70_05460 [Bacillus pseudomycoides]